MFIKKFYFLVSGHLADSLISSSWTVLSVRRCMTTIGLIGPSIFLLFFMSAESLQTALM